LAGSSPRFEQTYMDLQPQPLSAMELIAQEPIRLVQGRKAVCDGGQCFNFELALPGKRYGGVSKLPETS
jgi:NADH dehydrogenase (ubiquinone) Fe-S protein 6